MLANGAKETTATTGTGTVTLSAVTGFPRFSQVLSVGQFVDYAIRDGDNWEWGVGTVGAGNTLARTFVTAKFESGVYTKNPGGGISLAGTSEVFCTVHDASQRLNAAGIPVTEPRGPHGVLSVGDYASFVPVASFYANAAFGANYIGGRLLLWPVTIERRVTHLAGFHQGGSGTNLKPIVYRGDGPSGQPGTLVATGAGVGTGFRTLFQSALTGGPFTVRPGDWVGWLAEGGGGSLYPEVPILGKTSRAHTGEPPRPACGLGFVGTYSTGAPGTCPTSIADVLFERPWIGGVLA